MVEEYEGHTPIELMDGENARRPCCGSTTNSEVDLFPCDPFASRPQTQSHGAPFGGALRRLRARSCNECLKLADSDRNVDLYHWSSAKFSSTWYDTLPVLVAKGRAKVSVAASEADWSKRIREMQYANYEDHTVGS